MFPSHSIFHTYEATKVCIDVKDLGNDMVCIWYRSVFVNQSVILEIVMNCEPRERDLPRCGCHQPWLLAKPCALGMTP